MFKNLKSLFIVEEEGGSKKTAESKEKGSQESTAPESSSPISNAPRKIGKGQVKNKFLEVLFGAMERANQEGFDYLEYKQALKNLAKMPMDEPTRYQSAYAMAKTMGATPENLVSTANHYLKVLKDEEGKFEQALNSQKQQQIGHRMEQMKELQSVANEKAKMIEQLKKEIQDLEKKQADLRKTVENATVKVENTKNDFIASYQSLVAQISQDVEKMKQYLK